MTTSCLCGRSCDTCVYVKLCGGCLEEGCIHVRATREVKPSHLTKCFFCTKKGFAKSCTRAPLVPPKEFTCISPSMLQGTIDEWNKLRIRDGDRPEQPDWPLLLPEVSDVTETTSRLGVRPDEGDWSLGPFSAIAWDMTGYLFDRVHGAPWVRPSSRDENNWKYLTEFHKGEIEDLVFVDRLPDQLAMQTPPSGAMAEYLNRLLNCQWGLFAEEEQPSFWLMMHGYPSYVDWPPAWHWNLGIRMLASLVSYVGSSVSNYFGSRADVWYPDMSQRSDASILGPYVFADDNSRLVFPQYAEIDWETLPGIIPFVPGADTRQLFWFASHLVRAGYTTLAIDALNTISHENFAGLPEAVRCLKRAGAKHIMVYGPWPLHPPSNFVPLRDVTYIPSAHHMDMTDSPPRFWRKRNKSEGAADKKWQALPNYRTTSLQELAHREDIELCRCPACAAAVTREEVPVDIWRWGHLLHAGLRWQKRSKSTVEEPAGTDEETRLWYQGPSYTVYRRCLKYPGRSRNVCQDRPFGTVRVSETRMDLVYPDGWVGLPEHIRWTDKDVDHEWQSDFPRLED